MKELDSLRPLSIRLQWAEKPAKDSLGPRSIGPYRCLAHAARSGPRGNLSYDRCEQAGTLIVPGVHWTRRPRKGRHAGTVANGCNRILGMGRHQSLTFWAGRFIINPAD
jgi:hypothetical protein